MASGADQFANPGLWWAGPEPSPTDDQPTGGRSLLPSKDKVDKWKSSIELLLLVVGLPYLIWTLMTSPGKLFKGLGAKHLA